MGPYDKMFFVSVLKLLYRWQIKLVFAKFYTQTNALLYTIKY